MARRWSSLDDDANHLPEGLARVGYDADTQTYTYQDSQGHFWDGAPGDRYGVLRRRNRNALCEDGGYRRSAVVSTASASTTNTNTPAGSGSREAFDTFDKLNLSADGSIVSDKTEAVAVVDRGRVAGALRRFKNFGRFVAALMAARKKPEQSKPN